MPTPASMPAPAATSAQLLAYLDGSAALQRALPGGAAHALGGIEDVWLDWEGRRIHLDLHRASTARAVVVLQPGVGSYGRFYCALGALLAASGCHVLAVDRPGHGYSDGARGDCTVDEALRLSAHLIAQARARYGLPVILLGSSMGGLLVGYAVLAGQQPDLAIAHNFLLPGKLVSMRARAWFIRRFRRRPYPLHTLAHGFKGISDDPALLRYLAAAADPCAAWQQSPRAVASLLGYTPPPAGADLAPLVVLSGSADRIIPPWASRLFLRWARIPGARYQELPDAGHMLFHDHLDQALPVLAALIDHAVGRTMPACSGD